MRTSTIYSHILLNLRSNLDVESIRKFLYLLSLIDLDHVMMMEV